MMAAFTKRVSGQKGDPLRVYAAINRLHGGALTSASATGDTRPRIVLYLPESGFAQ